MARMLLPVAAFGLLMTAGGGCSRQDSEPGQDAAGQNGHADGPGGNRPGQQQAIPVSVTEATTGAISSYYRATATLEAEKQAEILARVTGVVRSLAAEEGDLVAEGAPLLVVANDEYRLRVLQAEARTANLRSRFERLEAMSAEQLTTDEEFQAAKSDLASAEADEGMARLNLSYTTVRAPFTGRVTSRMVDVGQNLSVGTALFRMSDFTPLLARVHVPSREFNRLQIDQPVDLVLDSTGQRLSGRIKLISPVIDPTSGTIKITVEVSTYPDGTRPGDFAEVQVVTERRENTVLVPREAVITEKGESVVFVVADPGPDAEEPVAERRVVTRGFTDDRHVEILTGLESGEMVVVRGQRSLKHGMSLKVMDDPQDRNVSR